MSAGVTFTGPRGTYAQLSLSHPRTSTETGLGRKRRTRRQPQAAWTSPQAQLWSSGAGLCRRESSRSHPELAGAAGAAGAAVPRAVEAVLIVMPSILGGNLCEPDSLTEGLRQLA
jgi:hypothetical protein